MSLDGGSGGYAPTMPEAHVFRDGALERDPVQIHDLRQVTSELKEGAWVWIDAVDPSVADLAELQQQLDMHDLAVEDVQHRDQRPKVEFYPGHVFIVFRPLRFVAGALEESELFVFASPRYLVTLRFTPVCDLGEAIRRWPMLAKLAPGAGSALYAVADEIADDYLEVVEALEDKADDLEDRVFGTRPPEEDPVRLQYELLRLRRDAVQLRRDAVPTRQALDHLSDASDLMTQNLVPYMRDVTDHLLRAVELADSVREVLTTIVELRTAQAANQLNEVMKKLTAWAGIVLVPTLIAGIYGMNFEHMPELPWVFGYPMALGIMAFSAMALYLGFRKRGWL
jgi:magnesium transporter